MTIYIHCDSHKGIVLLFQKSFMSNSCKSLFVSIHYNITRFGIIFVLQVTHIILYLNVKV